MAHSWLTKGARRAAGVAEIASLLASLLGAAGCSAPLPEAAPPELGVRLLVSDERTVRSAEHGLARLAAPCNPGSPEQRKAEEALGRLVASVDALGSGGEFVPALVALEEVLGSRCFRLADRERPARFAFEDARSLSAWWRGGGGLWLSSFLGANAGAVRVVVPPDARRGLSGVLPEEHPLRILLCPARAKECGAEAAPFLARAEQAYAAHAEAALAHRGRTEAACAERARSAFPDARYAAWRACVQELAPPRKLAPIDALRAPRVGWLTVRGFRDGPGGCEDLRAYDLATGSAYIATSCAAAAGPLVRSASGRLSAPALREATLAALLAPALETGLGEPRVFPLPEGISRVLPSPDDGESENEEPPPFEHQPVGRLGWTWEHRGLLLAGGALDWPSSVDAGQDHAAARLRAAERTFESGCSPAVLPRPLRFSGRHEATPAGEASPPPPNEALARRLKGLRWRPCARATPAHAALGLAAAKGR